MDKHARSDIAAFPELFGDSEPFLAELLETFRQTGRRLALALIPGGFVLALLLHRLP